MRIRKIEPRRMSKQDAERVLKRVHSESDAAASLSSNSKGAWFVHVTDPRKGDARRAPALTLTTEMDWDDNRSLYRRGRQA